jgi:hypothetical protein
MSPETAPRPTRTATIRPIVILTFVWVFLIAVVLQNVQRPSLPTPTMDAPAFIPFKMQIYVTTDNTVHTMENGVILPHIPLQVCANRDLLLESSENAPSVTYETMDWIDTVVAYSFVVDRNYYIQSSNMGIEVVFDDGEKVRLKVECPTVGADINFAAVFISNEMVYLADMTNGTATPLFWMEANCELVWSEGTRVHRAFPWEMSVPLDSNGSMVPGDSVVAFTFTTEGTTQLNMSDATAVSVVSDSGVVRVYSECGAPKLLPRLKP